MSIDVAYCYCTNLTEDQKLEIDEKVKENLEFFFGRKIVKIRFKKEKVFILLKNKVSRVKTKIVLPIVFFFLILTSYPKESKGMVRRADEIHRLCPEAQVKKSTPQTAPTISPSVDKILYREVRELPGLIYLMNDNLLGRREISLIIREIRGGSWTTAIIGNTIFLAFLYGIWVLASGSDGFVQRA